MNKDTLKKLQTTFVMFTVGAVMFFPTMTSHDKTLPTTAPLGNPSWWNPQWPYRKLITINHTNIAGNLENFPALLSRPSDPEVAAAAQPTGQDIVFIWYADNTTVLNHEIEHYNHTTGELVAWVNLPTLSTTKDTKLWMYYGNPLSPDQQHTEATWDAQFLAVHHLKQTTGTIYDSTSHHNDGTPSGNITYTPTAKIDGADYFDGIDDHITLPQVYTSENQFTMEAWIYPQTGARYILSQRATPLGVLLQVIEGGGALQYYVNDAKNQTDILLDTWYYVTLTYDGTTARLYLNGVIQNEMTCSAPTWPSTNLTIGDRTEGDRPFHGIIDEVRLSDNQRNTSWISTCYTNQNNATSFTTVGTEEQYEYALTTISNPPQGGTIVAAPNPPYHYNDIVTLTAVPSPGWLFTQWSGDLTGNQNPAILVINQNKTVIASFIQQNIPPVAVNDTAAVPENSSHNLIDVLANDYDPDGGNLAITAVTQPTHGTSSHDTDFAYYTPFPSYIGADLFTYTISDGQGGTATATVFITVQKLNSPPNTPSDPTPGNGTTNVSIHATLSWVGGDPDPGDTVTYDVYFGPTNPPVKVASNQTNTTYHPGTLMKNTTYYWRIVAWDDHNATTEGPVWHFTTERNNPPYKPSSPHPSNSETNVTIDTDLSWTGGDPNGDPVTYDVYFGTTNPPPKEASNQSTTTYHPGTLDYDTTYFWRIIAWDSYDASSAGDLWSFTTQHKEGNNIVVNITHPLQHSFYFHNLRLFRLPRHTFVYGPIDITAEVTADRTVRHVDFYIDGILKETDIQAPYTYRWAPLKCFRHQITVKAYDDQGNVAIDELTVFKWRLHPLLILGGAYLLSNQ